MDILTLLVVVPVLTIIGIGFTKDMKQTRLVSAIGMSIQLVIAAVLIVLYIRERNAGNMAEMLFMRDHCLVPDTEYSLYHWG